VDTLSAAEGLAELAQRRAAAQARVDQLEAEQRAATEGREAARAALVQAEREGVASARRSKLERALTDAEARTAERWPERIAGARAALIDTHADIGRFTAAHLDELVEGLAAEGEVVAANVNAAAAALVEAHQRREAIASEIAQTVYAAGIRVVPGLVTRSKADEAAHMAASLIQRGGEEPPGLTRDPREPTLGARAEVEAA
jgi:hypothetical protein